MKPCVDQAPNGICLLSWAKSTLSQIASQAAVPPSRNAPSEAARRLGPIWGWTWSCIGGGKWKQIDVTIPEPCNLGQNPVQPDSNFEFLSRPLLSIMKQFV